MKIEDFIQYIPSSLKVRSGSVFYSGRSAFSTSNDLYILGLNPGGSPEEQATETIEWHTNKILYEMPDDWSAYQDEQWKKTPVGSLGLQPRVLHLLRSVGIAPRRVPSSNLIFLRSAKESHLDVERWAPECWPFRQQVISKLGIRTILCFGKTSGGWVRREMGANTLIDEFVEKNERKWRNSVYENRDGVSVIVATHPSRVNWGNPLADPTPLVRASLNRIP